MAPHLAPSPTPARRSQALPAAFADTGATPQTTPTTPSSQISSSAPLTLCKAESVPESRRLATFWRHRWESRDPRSGWIWRSLFLLGALILGLFLLAVVAPLAVVGQNNGSASSQGAVCLDKDGDDLVGISELFDVIDAYFDQTPWSEMCPVVDPVADPLAMYDDNDDGRISCAEARAHGIAPVHRGHPAYPYMDDADNDGVVCES